MAVGLAVLIGGCIESGSTDPSSVPPPLEIDEVEFSPDLGIDLGAMEERSSGLWLGDEIVGEGEAVTESALLMVDYEGWLPTGVLFDTSLESQPFPVVLEQGGLIAGFADGLRGMREGGERLILVPPALGYGPRVVPTNRTTIPANSWLVFRIYLRSVDNS